MRIKLVYYCQFAIGVVLGHQRHFLTNAAMALFLHCYLLLFCSYILAFQATSE
jgi:hypothetical protein